MTARHRSSLIRIRPSCKRFTRLAMWRKGMRLHPAYARAEFERTESVGSPRRVTPTQFFQAKPSPENMLRVLGRWLSIDTFEDDAIAPADLVEQTRQLFERLSLQHPLQLSPAKVRQEIRHAS